MEREYKNNWIDYLAIDYMNSLDNHFELFKARTVLWLTILFGIILLFSFSRPPIYFHQQLIVCSLLVGCFFIPYLIQKKKEYIFSGKILLSILFSLNIALNILSASANLLLIGTSSITLIMVTSFILGKRWALFFSFIASLTILYISWRKAIYWIPSAVVGIGINWSAVDFQTPILAIGSIFFVYASLNEFIKYKDLADKHILTLLNTQQELNKNLQKSETKYRQIIEGADDMIYEINEQGNIAYMNPALQKITGYSLENGEISFVRSILKEYLAEHLDFYKVQIKNKTPLSYKEFPICTKTGSVIWLGQKTNMFFDTDGKLLYSLCLARDITAQKEIQECLIEAKEQAVNATLLKAQFLSSMSHEIRTPMNAVIGLTHLLLEETPRIDQQDHLKTLMFSAENLLKLINNILDFSKIEAGKLELYTDEFDFSEIVKNICHGFENQVKEKGIALVVNLDTHIPNKLIGDQLRVSQILNNLVGNAVKFTDRGSVNLGISIKNSFDDRIELGFIIEDTGIGIPTEKLSSIFDDFTQVNDANLRQGTGLGLSITKELLALHGSTIHVESTFGKGSSFHFTLPFGVVGRTPMPKQKNIENLDYKRDSLHGIQVLLVEDNKINQKVAINFLSKWGLEITIADNGAIALDKVQQKEYDIILMDLQMPVMNGIEATKAIRALGENYARLPILALTASAVLEIREQAIKSGLTDFITKPFVPDDLYKKIAQYALVEV